MKVSAQGQGACARHIYGLPPDRLQKVFPSGQPKDLALVLAQRPSDLSYGRQRARADAAPLPPKPGC
jgi:hypothetical protein